MKRVLVIDDDLLIGKLLHDHLTDEGLAVDTVTLAEEGFNSAIRQPPDLIMLDVNLPDATGFQMCGRFRQHPVTRTIPIIMMTGAARFPNQQAIGRQMGANDYILKPFDVLKVGQTVHQLLGMAQTPSAEEPAPPPPAAAPESLAPYLSRENNLTPSTAPLPEFQTAFDEIVLPSAGPMGPTPMAPAEMPSAPTNRWGDNLNYHEDVLPEPAVPPDTRAENREVTAPLESLPKSALEIPEGGASPTPPPLAEEPGVSVEPVWYELPLGPVQDAPREIPVIRASPYVEYSPPQAAPPAPETPVVQPWHDYQPPAEGHAAEPETLAPREPPEPIVLHHEPEPAVPASYPVGVAAPQEMPPPALSERWRLTWAVLGVHAILVGLTELLIKMPSANVWRGLTFTVGEWALFLGLIVGTAAVLGVVIEGRDALELLGLAALPIVLRSAGGVYAAFTDPKSLIHFMGQTTSLSAPLFWTRPLDIFQVIALVIVGWAFYRRPGGSPKKALTGALLIGLAWALLGRGYFKPF